MNVSAWDPALIWFLVGLILVLLEFAAPGIVLIFIGLGAWVTALAVKLGWATGSGPQMAWFAGSSLVLLLGLRRVFKSWFTGFATQHDGRSNLDDYVGSQVVILTRIDSQTRGQVEFKGAHWSARPANDTAPGTTFEPGERATITAVDGLCLLLKKP